jgi:hypothetical protein
MAASVAGTMAELLTELIKEAQASGNNEAVRLLQKARAKALEIKGAPGLCRAVPALTSARGSRMRTLQIAAECSKPGLSQPKEFLRMPTLPLHIERKLAFELAVDPRTIRATYHGGPQRKRSGVRERVAVALAREGFPPRATQDSEVTLATPRTEDSAHPSDDWVAAAAAMPR